jgi:uncharacterized coiled-coil protein SlyX
MSFALIMRLQGQNAAQATRIHELEQALDAAQDEIADLQETLCDVTNQACRMDDGEWDSCAISAYAAGMRMLAKRGVIEIKSEFGRRVIAVDKPHA